MPKVSREEWAKRIYKSYPHKRAPRRAKTAIIQALARYHKTMTAADLLQATVNFNEHWQKRLKRKGKDDIEHCPYCSTWMNDDGFLDDYAEEDPEEKNPYLKELP